MLWTRLRSLAQRLAVPAALLGLALTPQARADEPAKKPATSQDASRSAKEDLTPETFAGLHALIRPHDSEWRHLRVEWLTDVVAARKKAIAEDKPIIICYTGGAGYNEPLGVC
jgi:hypothetical protein